MLPVAELRSLSPFGEPRLEAASIRGDSSAGHALLPSSAVEWFVVAQTAIPALLYLPGAQTYRLPIRVAAYAVALGGFGLWFLFTRRKVNRHPAEQWLVLVTTCLLVMILHPMSNSPQAGVAQALLYFSVCCALFWVPVHVRTTQQLVRILAVFLVCNGINSIVGVLQVYDPNRWMPAQLSAVFETDVDRFMAATYIGANGNRIVRPPGLFDTPGAVCGPGSIAAMLGLVFALERLTWWRRLAAACFALAGVSAIYLSHVRANYVVLLVTMCVYVVALLVQGQRGRATRFASLSLAVLIVGMMASVGLGGESTRQRFASLVEDDPPSIYYESRGRQLEHFSALAEMYPMGAGLGRWGMMRGYFGDPSNLDSSALWAELQPNAWLLDGGWFLVILYSTTLVVTARYEWSLLRFLLRQEDRRWAAAVVAVNMGTIALVFSFVPFTTQVGLQFWFLEGALHGALASRIRA